MPRHLSDWLDGWMEYTDRSEPCRLYKLWVGMGTIAACLKRKCRLEWGFKPLFPNMYIVLVGPSGSRKGTAMAPSVALLRKKTVKLAAEAITREALIREICESITESTIDPIQGVQVEGHSSLTIFSEELTVFLGYQNTQLMTDLTDWYDCNSPWRYRTKNKGEDDIFGIWVNLVGATTPDLLRSTLTREHTGGGLTARMMFVYGDKKSKLLPDPKLTKEQIAMGLLLADDMDALLSMHGEFKVSAEFMEVWDAWYMRHEIDIPFEDERFYGYFARRGPTMLKMCMLVSASRSNDMKIAVADFDRAKNILTETEVDMRKTFGGIGAAKQAGVTDMIMKHFEKNPDWITFADLLMKFHVDAGKAELADILSTLVSMNFCQMEEREDGTSLRRTPREH